MTKQELLVAWLGNRQRKYADGLALFKELAPASMKGRYLAYLEQINEEPEQFDQHYTMLKNKLSDIGRNIRTSPAAYPKAFEETVAVQALNEDEVANEVQKREAIINELQEQNDDLSEQVVELENSDEEKSDEIDTLKETIKSNEATIQKQQEELKALNTPGIKIVAEADLPPKMTKSYARIKEIVPLYASLHNDIANPDTPEEDRKKLAEQLCKLDDERRKLWKEIDNWAEGKTVNLDAERPQFSENKVVRGVEIARHIVRLKQNIQNCKGAITRAENDGKETIKQNAVARMANYEAELTELEKELASEKAEG